jgi:hypothetical protein
MLAVEVEGFGGPAVIWTVQDFKKQPTGQDLSGTGPTCCGTGLFAISTAEPF